MKRLVLFDIDGTLLTAGGAGKHAVTDALVAVFGTAGEVRSYSFAGRTDPQIVTELITSTGMPKADMEARLPDFWDAYLANLEREIPNAHVAALPGVPELLDRVEAAGGDVVLGLLSGNVQAGARIKVRAAGIDFDRFTVGAFGSDHADRSELPAVAVRRARDRTGLDFSGKEIVILGDTPFDIACGEHLGVRTIAVATGGHSEAELAACGPDFVFRDLTDTDAVWAAIAG